MEEARNSEIVSQMKGKAIPGGVHEGRFTSRGVAAPSCSERFGRLAGRSAKTRERNERKKKRGGGYESGSSSKMPKVVEVNQSSLVGGIAERSASNPIRDALGDDYEQRLRNQAGNLPGQMARRKHQIGSLLYDSKMAELELLESRAKSVKTKRETQAKYGW